MDQKAKLHLSCDMVLKKLLASCQIKEYYGEQSNYFLNLIEIITSQQLSTKAAATIFKRFISIFKTKNRSTAVLSPASSRSPFGDSQSGPTPQQVLKISTDQLRAIGFSRSKAQYARHLASAVISGSLPIDKLDLLSDNEVKTELLKIKGIGPWSVEMFLMFSLKRPDIFSVGDLGLRAAIEKLYGISRDDKNAILALAQTWRPHRTLASRLLWSSLD